MEIVRNKTFDEINIGDSASLSRTLTVQDITSFAAITGDYNPAHMDAEYAKGDIFHRIVAHGMWGGSLFSTLLGMHLPGPGTIYLSQSLKFLKPVAIADKIKVTITVIEKKDCNKIVLDCISIDQKNEKVITGIAEVIAPTEKIERPVISHPDSLNG